MKTFVVHQLRAFAPDKFLLPVHENVELVKHDMCNLTDFNCIDLLKIQAEKEYVLPADEGDIKHINNMEIEDQSFVLLPLTSDKKVIQYEKFIPKDSIIYKELEQYTKVKYMPFKSYSLDEFKEINIDSDQRVAYKTSTGSGSRGILLIDPDRVHLGGKYRAYLNLSDFSNFMQFAENEKCNILVQELIPNDSNLFKVNVDFVIKDKKLLGYKWDLVNQSQQFTNWDNFYMIRNEYTDKVMKNITTYLIDLGITDAIMNFEAFSNLVNETILIEFNWRYSNSMFEWSGIGIDPIYQYLLGESFMEAIPLGTKRRFCRHWMCTAYDEVPHIVGTK